MPAPRLYIGSGEIAALLGVSLREAQYIIKGYELQGKTLNLKRNKRVALRTFANDIAAQDGSDPNKLFYDLKEELKTMDGCHRISPGQRPIITKLEREA